MASCTSSASEKEESVAHTTDCQQNETEDVQEVTHLLANVEVTDTHASIESQQTNLPRKFTIEQKKQILSICPVNDQAWLSILEYKGLLLVNREGEVVETVQLAFCPYRLAMVGAEDILMTCKPLRTSIHKMSLHDKQVTEFADIKPYTARDISINNTGEVFVSTKTPHIVVLNQSGTFVRNLTIPVYGSCIVCLSLGIAVSGSKGNYITTKVILVDESGTDIHTWSGDLDNGQTPTSMYLCKMSCDKDDRLFVPDYKNNQVYVLPWNGTRATCLLDKKHGVDKPSAVGVDTRGNIWIGCEDGTVHVMRLSKK